MGVKVFLAMGVGFVAVNGAVFGAVHQFAPSASASFTTAPISVNPVPSPSQSSSEGDASDVPGEGVQGEAQDGEQGGRGQQVGEVVRDLLKKAGRRTVASHGSLGLPADSSCNDGLPVLAPATVSEGVGQTTGSYAGGVSYQVKVYPAGVAAAVLADTETVLRGCGITAYPLPLSDVKGFYYTEQAMVGGPVGTTVIFHDSSDFVGVVASRDVSPQWAVSRALMWQSRWAPVLKGNSLVRQCRPVTVGDASRNPVWEKYEGWRRPVDVQLSATQESASSVATTLWYGTESGSSSRFASPASGELPESPFPYYNSSDSFTLPWFPDYVKVSLPAKPRFVEPGSFPDPVSDRSVVTLQMKDSSGPGCGWKYLGADPPLFDVEKAKRETREKYYAAVSQLVEDRRRYDQQRWMYAVQYAEYRKSLRLLEEWQTQSTELIAQKWWADYDRKYGKYRTQYATWQQEHKEWEANVLACETLLPEPTPTPTFPNPSVEPTPEATPYTSPAAYLPTDTKIVFTCPAPSEPVEPVPPTLPTIPRP